MILAGHIEKGKHFKLRKNGKIYTVHQRALGDNMNGLPSEIKTLYVIAFSNRVMYAIDWHTKVIPCD